MQCQTVRQLGNHLASDVLADFALQLRSNVLQLAHQFRTAEMSAAKAAPRVTIETYCVLAVCFWVVYRPEFGVTVPQVAEYSLPILIGRQTQFSRTPDKEQSRAGGITVPD